MQVHNYNTRGSRLSQLELDIILPTVERKPAGFYKLPELLAGIWEGFVRPREVGKSFRASERLGLIPGVRWKGTGSDNRHIYERFID